MVNKHLSVGRKLQQKSSTYNELEIDNLPNRITLFRICLIPIISSCLLLYQWDYEWIRPLRDYLGWIAGWTFTIASITDFFDGHMARKMGITTIFGSFLDPVADKFLVVSSLILLQNLGRIPAIVVVILVLREIYMTSLRMLAASEGISVPVSPLGKWKTTTQMIGIPMLMANGPIVGLPLPIIGTISIYIASVLSLYSATLYSIGLVRRIKITRMKLRRKKREKK